jgi:hypothetical protein
MTTTKRPRRPWPRTPLIPPPARCECVECALYRERVAVLKAAIEEAAQMAIEEGPEIDGCG